MGNYGLLNTCKHTHIMINAAVVEGKQIVITGRRE